MKDVKIQQHLSLGVRKNLGESSRFASKSGHNLHMLKTTGAKALVRYLDGAFAETPS